MSSLAQQAYSVSVLDSKSELSLTGDVETKSDERLLGGERDRYSTSENSTTRKISTSVVYGQDRTQSALSTSLSTSPPSSLSPLVSSSHEEDNHSTFSPYFSAPRCPQCSIVFLDIYCLRLHAKEVHGDQRFDCITCGKRFRDRYDLKQHAHSQSHRELVSDDTKLCNDYESDAGRNVNDTPTQEHIGALSEAQVNPAEISWPVSPVLPLSSVSADAAYSVPLRSEADVCHDSALFDALTTVTASIKRHLQQPQLQVRKRARPAAPSSSVCETCGKEFKCSSLLANHVRVHTGDRPYACEFPGCTKRFTERSNLTKHTKVHSGDHPFKCEYEGCGKAFTAKCNLQTHMRIHTAEKPFACERAECGRRFTDISDLRKHKLRHQWWDEKDELRAKKAEVSDVKHAQQ